MCRARRAYELGRARGAAIWAVRVVPLVLLAVVVAHGGVRSALFGAALYAAAAVLRWRGQGYGRAVPAGLLAGAVPLLVTMLVPRAGHCCAGGTCLPICMAACVGSGLVAGALIAVAATLQADARRVFIGSAVLVAALAGAVGCVLVSLAGVAGMAAGLLVASTPFLIAARPRAR